MLKKLLVAVLLFPTIASGRVAVVGDSLGDAISNFAKATNTQRVDCDLLADGRWICADFSNPQQSDLGSSTATQNTSATTSTTTQQTSTASTASTTNNTQTSTSNSSRDTNGRIAVFSNSLGGARAAYSQLSAGAPTDCDSANGGWICANFRNPTMDAVTKSTSQSSQTETETETQTQTQTATQTQTQTQTQNSNQTQTDSHLEAQTDSSTTTSSSGSSNGRVAVFNTSLPAARAALAQATSTGSVDCDSAAGGWVCANFNNPTISDVTGVTTSSSSQASNSSVSQTLSSSRFKSGDLIVLEYDNCPDIDDIHAAVSGKMVLDHHGLINGKDYIVVNGTCGTKRPANDFAVNSPAIFNKLYGSSWYNAYGKNGNTVALNSGIASTVAAKMRATLQAGRNVWVASGGPMDFTAMALRSLKSDGVSRNFKNVNVAQHSQGWNAKHTGDANLAFVKNTAQYHAVDNGNLGGNRSAQLNMININNSNYQRVDNALVARYKNNAKYGDEWELAFNLLNPSFKFDGSDTVELLYILDIGINEVADWYDFADKYLPTSNTQSQTQNQTQTSSTIRFQAESQGAGGGWASESGTIRWTGKNLYSPSQAGAGLRSFSFTASSNGVYQLKLRARAVNPAAGDQNNDAWFKLNGQNIGNDFTKWTKVFISGSGQWIYGGTADFHSTKPAFKQRLKAGYQYSLNLSGRSNGFAIDYIDLVKVSD